MTRSRLWYTESMVGYHLFPETMADRIKLYRTQGAELVQVCRAVICSLSETRFGCDRVRRWFVSLCTKGKRMPLTDALKRGSFEDKQGHGGRWIGNGRNLSSMWPWGCVWPEPCTQPLRSKFGVNSWVTNEC